MIPARDRLTKLYVYDTEADMLDDLNGTEYTSGVVDGSQRFEHTFFNAFPSFGEANAAMYQCDISGTGDLTEKYIRVKYSYYATASTSTRTDRWLFAGKVDKCTYDRYKTVRSLTAYDKLYELRSVDISAWWTTYWASQSTDKTYAQFVVDMCSAFGVTTDWQNLTDASGTIVYATAKNLRLAGCSFVEMLRYIGQLTRYSWFILANGKLGRSYLHNNIWQRNIDDAIDTSTTEYGDEPLPAYASVMAYDGADVIYTYGSGSPTWTIRDNPLLKGKTTSQIATELDSLRSKLAVTAGYYPLTADMIVSSPDDLNIGYDNLLNVKTTDGTLTRKHVIAGIRLWGPQLINQQIICPHEMEQGDSLSPSMSAALSEIQKMGVEMTYKVNADNVIEAVNMEASDTVKINAQAINLNGAVTANQNFKILLDGSMETIAGKLGGWLIDSNRLYKTYNGETIELSSNEYAFGISTSDANNNYVWIRPSGLTTEHKLQGYSDVATGYTNMQGNEVEQATEVWEAHAEWSDYVERTHSQMKDGTLILEKRTPDGDGFYFDRPWITTEVSPDTLKIGGKDILRTHQSLVGGWGTAIPSGADLNSLTYLAVGRYYVGTDAVAASLSNCPASYAFCMEVYAPISSTIDNESTGTWVYRIQRITRFDGVEYTRRASSGATAGAFTFEPWYRKHDSRISEENSAYWMKAQVNRPTSLNFTHINDDSRAHMRVDQVSGSVSSNPFSGDGYVLTFMWDTSAEWDTQVFFPCGSGAPEFRRKRNQSSWETKTKFITEQTYSDGTLTPNSGSFSEKYCRQAGRVVDIHGWLTGLSTTTQSHANAIKVTNVSLPSVPIRFVFTCWLGNSIASYAGYGVLDTYGNISFVKGVANSDKVSFAISYVV